MFPQVPLPSSPGAGYPQQGGQGPYGYPQPGGQGPYGYPQQQYGLPPGNYPQQYPGYSQQNPGYMLPQNQNRRPPPNEGIELDGESTTGMATAFGEKSVCRSFIRKVYSILACQLAITISIIAIFTFNDDAKKWVRANPGVFWAAIALAFATLIALSCCGDLRRKTPMNYICLGLFTVAQSFLAGVVASRYNEVTVIMAFGVTLVIVISLTIFAFQTKIDFTMLGGILFVALILLLILSIVGIFFQSYILKMLIASFGALLFCVYLIYDTQLMVGGNHKYSISPEEYVFAALSLYIDVMNIFLYILQIIGLLKDD